MNKETQEHLKEIIDKYDRATTEMSEAIISELKKDCKNYGELEKQMAKFRGFVHWEINKIKAESLLALLDLSIQTEKNDLLMTNRS